MAIRCDVIIDIPFLQICVCVWYLEFSSAPALYRCLAPENIRIGTANTKRMKCWLQKPLNLFSDLHYTFFLVHKNYEYPKINASAAKYLRWGNCEASAYFLINTSSYLDNVHLKINAVCHKKQCFNHCKLRGLGYQCFRAGGINVSNLS